MKLLITSPNFTAALRLAEALSDHGLDVAIIEWGKTPQREPGPDDRWLVLVPEELPVFASLPKCAYGQIDVDASLEEQVDLALQELRWQPV